MEESTKQILMIALPAIIAAAPGIIALIIQGKKEDKKIDVEKKKVSVESQISLSDASLRWVDRVEKELLTLKEQIAKLEKENKKLRQMVEILEQENADLQATTNRQARRIEELEKNNGGY